MCICWCVTEIKFYMFRTALLSIISTFFNYTQQWYMSYRFADSLRAKQDVRPDTADSKLCDINRCCVYSEKLLMMDTGNVRNR